MIDEKQGQIITKESVQARTDVAGHPGITVYPMARPGTNCRWLLVALDVIEEGGGIDPHYHAGVDFDHAYYVMSGEVMARIGDEEFRVGPDSLMLFPCGTVHGFKVISKGGARVLRLGASDTGVASGGNTYLKE